MKTQVKNALKTLIQAVENYDPTINGNVNSLVTEGLIIHLKGVAYEILNATPEDYVTNAAYYLSDSDMTLEEQIEAIANNENQDEYIDTVEGVCVWSPLEDTYTCEEFLELIGR